MSNFIVFMVLTIIMGLSIFLAMPIVFLKVSQHSIGFLTALAIGILLFLLADIFGDIMPILYLSNSYIIGLENFMIFALTFCLTFAALYYVETRPRKEPQNELSRTQTTAFIIATGIALQNITEGLVFGANWTAGTISLATVVFVGFFFQNITEGFPIASPFLGAKQRNLPVMAGLFFIGGVPTVIGGAIGYHWSSSLFILIFDSMAIGAILYVILPMFKDAFRELESKQETFKRNKFVYIGIMVGFLLGFAVNAI